MLLADKGTQAAGAGTLNLLNVGWGTTQLAGDLTPPHAVAVFLEAELAECNRALTVTVELLDQDGKPVELPGPAGPQPMRLEQGMTIAPPSGAPTGTPGKANILLEISPGLPLKPGTYRWRVHVEGKTHDAWAASFHVALPPSAPVFGAPPPE